MNCAVALSCMQVQLLLEEVINVVTINNAFAMELQNEVGSIIIDKKAI